MCLFGALAEEGLEVSFQKTTWIASSPAVEAALKQQSHGDPVQVSSVAKDLGVANAAGRARRTHIQAKRLRKGTARGLELHSLKIHKTSHRVRVSKMGCPCRLLGAPRVGPQPETAAGPLHSRSPSRQEAAAWQR